MDNASQSTIESKYRAPSLSILGSLYERTLQEKVAGLSDGLFLLGVGPITNASV